MADTLVDDFEVIDFRHVLAERCVQLLGVSAAGLLLTDQQGALQVVAASSERTRLLELFQLQTDQGVVCGLLPHRSAGVGHRPAVGWALAAVHRGRRRGGLRRGNALPG